MAMGSRPALDVPVPFASQVEAFGGPTSATARLSEFDYDELSMPPLTLVAHRVGGVALCLLLVLPLVVCQSDSCRSLGDEYEPCASTGESCSSAYVHYCANTVARAC